MRTLNSTFISEKNTQTNSPIFLYTIYDYDGGSTNLYYTNYIEDVTYDSVTYTAIPITHSAINENVNGSLSTVHLTFSNVERTLQALVDTYDFRRKKVTLKLVWANQLADTSAYLEDTFYIDNYSANSHSRITFNLTSKLDVLSVTIPHRTFTRNICPWKFKVSQCGYAGGESSCNKTFTRCQELSNQGRFGGFPSSPVRKFSSGGNIASLNPTYNTQGPQTRQSTIVGIPIIYGENVYGGNVINQYIWTDGDNHYLNTLLGLCEGEIDSLSDILVNDSALSTYDGASDDEVYGTNSQGALTDFEDLHSLVSINTEIVQATPYEYTTVKSDCVAFELRFECPNGLYHTDLETNEDQSLTMEYKVEYRVHGDPSYTNAGTFDFSKKSQSVVLHNYRKDGLTAEQYDIKITKISNDSDDDDTRDLYIMYIDEISADDLTYPNTALLAIKNLPMDQISNSFPNITCTIKGLKISVPKVMNGVDTVDWEDYYWNSDNSEYRLLDGDTSLTWDGTTYIDQYCANPVWCLKDFLTNSRYGLGEFITSGMIDDTTFLNMSRYCEEKVDDGDSGYEKRFRFDIVIDSDYAALDLVNIIANSFHGLMFYTNGSIKLTIDKEETTSGIPIFGMGDILKDSFSQTWKSTKNIPNFVEATFVDIEKNSEQETVAYTDETAIVAGDPIRKDSIQVFSKSVSQVLREARYYLKKKKYVTRQIQFQTAISGVGTQPGDIIGISHDVPQWGYSGRVKTGSTTTSIKLDRSVTIGGGTYKLQVRLTDDSVEEKTVTNSPGTTDTITVSSAFTSMDEYNSYSFGADGSVVEEFRVIDVSRNSSGIVSITAETYSTSVYDDTAPNLPDDNYSELLLGVQDVEDLELTEGVIKKEDGTYQMTIEVWFNKPVPTTATAVESYSHAEIWLSDDNSGWDLVGTTSGTHFTIASNILRRDWTYYVIVKSVGTHTSNKLSAAPSDNITLTGGDDTPPDVANLEIFDQGNDTNFLGKDVKFKWAHVSHYGAGDAEPGDSGAGDSYTDINFKDYKVQILVDGSVVRTEYVTDNWYEYTFEKNLADNNNDPQSSLTIRVWQRNYYNKESDSYAELSVTNPVPKIVSGITSDFSGRDLVLSWSPRPTCDPDFRRYKIIVTGDGGARTYYRDATSFFYSYDENVDQNGSNGDRSLTVDIYAEDWFGQLSTISTITPTNSVPATPTVSVESFFNAALLKWTDVNDTDLKYYEIWQSTTDVWAGEEELIHKSSGTTAILKVDADDSILYFKVRGVDTFGEGSFSTSVEANFINIDSDDICACAITCTHIGECSIHTPHLAACAVTAEKVTTGELLTLSAQIRYGIIEDAHIACLDAGKIITGELCADRIGAGCIQACKGICISTDEGSTAKTVFDSYGVKSYDAGGNLKFQVCDGHIEAQDIRLQDPDCACCYSYLDAGALKFHDECGDVPYVKRICSGVADTGDTVCLNGWKTAPEVMVGIKSVRSYDSGHSAQCQLWDVYADNVVCYNIGGCYGYSFDVHATLQVEEGIGDECVKDISFGTCTYTGECVCETCVRMKFQIWCNAAPPSCYKYGYLCYDVCYRKYGDATWCGCSATYCQPHSSVGELKDTQDRFITLSFPCSECWQLMACQTGLTWCDTTLPAGSIQCCTCSTTGPDIAVCCSIYCFTGSYNESLECRSNFVSSAPSNTFCTCACYCLCYRFQSALANPGGYAYHNWCMVLESSTTLTCNQYATYGNNQYSCICNCAMTTAHSGGADYIAVKTYSCMYKGGTELITCIYDVHATYCYCVVSGGADSCEYKKLYSITDTYGCQCVLDPTGTLNWLAIAYA